jgi:hypothetical protein
MAQISNTWETFDATGIREELADKIYRITPEETPFLTLVSHVPIKTTHPEWQIDTLASPDTTNNQPEGNDWTYAALSATSRVGNYAQISDKTLIVSNTLDETDKAGRKSELAYQVAKKGRELKTDMESILLSNQASLAGSGNGATNRKSGGLRAWLATNDDLGGGGSSGGYNTSTNVVDAATNGTQRAFTKAIMDSCILNAYNAGGSPTVAMCSPYVKTVFSTFLDDANIVPLRVNVDNPKSNKNTLVASAEIYHSDFGNITFMPNRQMARAGAAVARNCFFIDPSMVAMGVFRDVQIHKPAITGDAEKRVLNTEYTLLVRNEAAHAVAADLYGLTAST